MYCTYSFKDLGKYEMIIKMKIIVKQFSKIKYGEYVKKKLIS